MKPLSTPNARPAVYASALLAALLACSLCVLAGCSAMAAERAQVGEPADGTVAVNVENGTGKDIEAFYVKADPDGKYGAALAQDGLVASGQSVVVNMPADAAGKVDVRIVTSDGAKYELKRLVPARIRDAVLKLAAGGTSCYIEYTDATSGAVTSILESEQTAKEQAAAAKKAKAEAAEAKKAAAAAKKAAADGAAQTAAQASESASSPSGTGASKSGTSASSASSKAKSGSTSSKNSKSTSSAKKSSGSKGSSGASKGSASGSAGSSSSGASDAEDDRCIEL